MAQWAYCAGTFSSHIVTFAGEEAGTGAGGNVQKRKPDNGGGVVGRAQTADLK